MKWVRADETSSNRTAALVSEGHDIADNALPTPSAERQSNGNARVEKHTFDHKNDTNARTDTQVLADASKTPLLPGKEISTAEDPSAGRQSNWNARAEEKAMDQKNDKNARPDMQGLVDASQIPLPPEKEKPAAEDPSAEHQSNGNDPNARPQVLADASKTPLPLEKERSAAEDPSAGRQSNGNALAEGTTIDPKNDTNVRPVMQELAEASKMPLPPGEENSAAGDPLADTADKDELISAEQAHPHRKVEHSSFYEGSGGSTQDERFSRSAVDPLSKDTTMTPGAFPDDDEGSVYSELSLNDKVAQEPASATNDARNGSPVDKEESFKQSEGPSQEHPVSKDATEPKRRSFSPGPAESSDSSGTEPVQEWDLEPWTNEEGESEPVQTPPKTLPAGEVRKSVESLPKKSPRQSVTASSPLGKADTDKPPTSPERLRAPLGNSASAETTESPEDIAPRQKVNVSTQGPVESIPKSSPRQSVSASSPLAKADTDKSPSLLERLWVPIGNYASGKTVESPEDTAPRDTVNFSTQSPSAPKASPKSEGATERAKTNDPLVTSSAAVAQTVDRRASEVPVHHIQQSKYDNQKATSESLASSPDVTGVSKAGQQVDNRLSLPEDKDNNQEATADPLADSPDITGFSNAGQQVDKDHSLPQDRDDNQVTTSNPLAESPDVTRFSKAGQQVDNKFSLPEDRDGDEEAGQTNESQPPELKRSETQPADIMKRISVPPSTNAREEDGDEEAGQQSEGQTPKLKRSETKPVDIMDRISVPSSIYARDRDDEEEVEQQGERQTPELKRSETKAVDIMDRVSVPPSINSRRGSKPAKKVTLPPPKIFVQSPSDATPFDDELAEPHPTPAGYLPNDEYRITSRNGSIVSVQHTVNSAAEKLGSPRVKKRKLYLRKARNLAARRVFLNAALGKKMGGRTKDKLQRLARGEEVPSIPVSIKPNAADSPPLKKRKSVIRKVRNVASRQSLLDAALGRQVGRETKPVLRRMAKGENIVVEEA